MPKKNGRRQSVNEEEENAKALAEMIEKLHERQKLEEERQERWNEAWQRKLVEDEQSEDLKACCAPDQYFPAPRAQANIWLQVSHEKNTQRVQMSFMNVAIPKPEAPPLPKLPPPNEPPKDEEDPDNSKSDANNKKKKKKKNK